MAKAKAKTKHSKSTDGDDLIEDDAASVAVAARPEKPARAKRASKNGTASKAQTKKQKAGARKTGPAASKAKASSEQAKASSGRAVFNHKTPKAGKKFERVYKGKTHTMTVKASAKAESGVVYVYQGKTYADPTDAASAAIRVGKDRATGTNGWFFWGISQRPERK